MNVVPELRTHRLTLRPWELKDADAFHAIWGDARVIWWGHSADIQTSRALLVSILERVGNMPAGLGWWAAVERSTGDIVANAMLQPARFAPDVEVGYHVRHDAWGRGIATEASASLIEHGLRTVKLPQIVAAVHTDNSASMRVASKLGMQDVGFINHSGLPHRMFIIRAP